MCHIFMLVSSKFYSVYPTEMLFLSEFESQTSHNISKNYLLSKHILIYQINPMDTFEDTLVYFENLCGLNVYLYLLICRVNISITIYPSPTQPMIYS